MAALAIEVYRVLPAKTGQSAIRAQPVIDLNKHTAVIVEGRLSDDRLSSLQRQTIATLERLDASAWEIEPP